METTWACARDIVRVGVGLWLATATGGRAAPQELAGMRGKQYSGGCCSFEWPDLSNAHVLVHQFHPFCSFEVRLPLLWIFGVLHFFATMVCHVGKTVLAAQVSEPYLALFSLESANRRSSKGPFLQ